MVHRTYTLCHMIWVQRIHWASEYYRVYCKGPTLYHMIRFNEFSERPWLSASSLPRLKMTRCRYLPIHRPMSMHTPMPMTMYPCHDSTCILADDCACIAANDWPSLPMRIHASLPMIREHTLYRIIIGCPHCLRDTSLPILHLLCSVPGADIWPKNLAFIRTGN